MLYGSNIDKFWKGPFIPVYGVSMLSLSELAAGFYCFMILAPAAAIHLLKPAPDSAFPADPS